ncbi:hypothetical protein PQO03_14610 [Lentisphaera profundi]|uniref:Uncharacterized protein n=1 Tax=Lentisphaera profundi TaxID=1658616 RepID=A0ABY7VXS8_9BACT|nr:hypothetical protein [Lentisphaera profundi]WDE99066.1 hypothetical protein PQO03_14610 [Lentisphaera profundi]
MRKVLGKHEKPMAFQLQDGFARYLFSIVATILAVFLIHVLVNNGVDMFNFIDINSAGSGGLTHDDETVVWLRRGLSILAAFYCFKRTS